MGLEAAELDCGAGSGEDPWPTPGAQGGFAAQLGAGVSEQKLQQLPGSPWMCAICSTQQNPPGAVQMLVKFQVFCAQLPIISFSDYFISAKPFESGQYLDIYGITRDQAGEYECSAENDVSVPDVRKVKVTVNCKSYCFLITKSNGEEGCS